MATHAERQRRYRERKLIGVVPMTVELDRDFLAMLAERGLIDETWDEHALSIRLGELFEDSMRKCVTASQGTGHRE